MTIFAIDITTVLLFLFFGNLVTAGLLSIHTNDSVAQRLYRQFLAGKLLQSAAWLLLALRGKIPDVLSAHAGNSLLMAGIAFEALAMISVEKQRRHWETYYAITVVVFTVIFWGFAKQPNQYVYVSSTFAAAIFLSVAILVVHDVKKSTLRYVLSLIYTASSLILLVRSINAFLHSDYRLMSNDFSQILTFLSTYFLMIISGSSFLLLLRERTDEMLKVANQELKQLVHIDSLTSLANRRKFREHLTHCIFESRRRAEPLALIMADIDFFKKYNDYYGHIFGDRCLAQVAQEMKQHCQRKTDLIARYGGEEFAIVLLNTDIKKAFLTAEAIREGIHSLGIPHEDSDVSNCVTLSLGIFSAIPSSDEHDYDWFIIEADRRLYEAKHAGRNQSICK